MKQTSARFLVTPRFCSGTEADIEVLQTVIDGEMTIGHSQSIDHRYWKWIMEALWATTYTDKIGVFGFLACKIDDW